LIMAYKKDKEKEDITRRRFLSGITVPAVGFALLRSRVSGEQSKPSNNPKVEQEFVKFKSGSDTIEGYLARPSGRGQYPAVIIIPGNLGLADYIRKTAEQLAQNGFIGMGINMFSRNPELPNTEAAGRVFEHMTDMQILQDYQSGIDFLKQQSFVKPGGAGVIGFGMGGRFGLLLAANSKDVKATVPFYAPLVLSAREKTANHPTSPMDVVNQIKSPVQGHYAALNLDAPREHVRTEHLKEFENALRSQGVPVEMFIYGGVKRSFFSYTDASYDSEAAQLALARTLKFLAQYLK
jgi:carboxymethylenebutenolidase